MDALDIIINIIKLAGGLALFLYGMGLMGDSLETISGSTMERVLQKLTNNPIKGVLLGAVITGIIQSSSATTVIVVGLVNAGVLKLTSAVGVIMGANIGTTVTAQILRLGDVGEDGGIMQLFNPSSLAPIICVLGFLIYILAKRKRNKDLALIFIGLGVLFFGMLNMEAAVKPIAEMDGVKELFLMFKNPLLGVLVGAVVTAVIQSSSASIGILQALSSTGLITFGAAFPIIMGQNIGTCITPILASIGASKNAKRSAMVHLYFNIIGTIIFLLGVYAIQYTIGLPFWDDEVNRGVIANFHTLFNVTVTIILLPFYKLLAKLATLTIPDKKAVSSEEDDDESIDTMQDILLVSPAVALTQTKEALVKMGNCSLKNYRKSIGLFENYDDKVFDKIKTREDLIDKLEDRISSYTIKLNEKNLTDEESRAITEILHLVNEYERVGDYAINLAEQAQYLYDKKLSFSQSAIDDLKAIGDAAEEVISMAVEAYMNNDIKLAKRIEPLEETIDIMIDKLKYKHIKRLKEGTCAIDLGVNFLEALTGIERISDHCSNVAVYILSFNYGADDLNRHEYISALHSGSDPHYERLISEYKDKYLVRIE